MLWIQSCNQYIYLQFKNYAWTAFGLRAPLSNSWLKSCKCATIFTKIPLLSVYISRMRQYQLNKDHIQSSWVCSLCPDIRETGTRSGRGSQGHCLLSGILHPNNLMKQANEDLIYIKSLPKNIFKLQCKSDRVQSSILKLQQVLETQLIEITIPTHCLLDLDLVFWRVKRRQSQQYVGDIQLMLEFIIWTVHCSCLSTDK